MQSFVDIANSSQISVLAPDGLDMLAGLDCVVCDLQDLGVRCYTYLATSAT